MMETFEEAVSCPAGWSSKSWEEMPHQGKAMYRSLTDEIAQLKDERKGMLMRMDDVQCRNELLLIKLRQYHARISMVVALKDWLAAKRAVFSWFFNAIRRRSAIRMANRNG